MKKNFVQREVADGGVSVNEFALDDDTTEIRRVARVSSMVTVPTPDLAGPMGGRVRESIQAKQHHHLQTVLYGPILTACRRAEEECQSNEDALGYIRKIRAFCEGTGEL